MSSRREEIAQRKPFKRVFSGLFRKQKGCGPFEIPGFPDLQCLTSRAPPTYFGSTLFLVCTALLVCKMADDLPAEQQIWWHLSAARHFCSAKILAGGLRLGRGPHRRVGSPRAKKFPEEICFAPSRVCQVCRTPDYRVLKSTQYAQLVQPSVPGSPGARGAAPLCFRRSPEETLSRVSSGQFLRGGSTPRFFAQLRSVVSNHPAGRLLPVELWRLRHGKK